MTEYRPDLPAGHPDAGKVRIDTGHARYKAFEEYAKRHNLSQAAFSEGLAFEAERASVASRASQPPAAPAPAAPKPDFSKMSTAQKFEHALASAPTRAPLR